MPNTAAKMMLPADFADAPISVVRRSLNFLVTVAAIGAVVLVLLPLGAVYIRMPASMATAATRAIRAAEAESRDGPRTVDHRGDRERIRSRPREDSRRRLRRFRRQAVPGGDDVCRRSRGHLGVTWTYETLRAARAAPAALTPRSSRTLPRSRASGSHDALERGDVAVAATIVVDLVPQRRRDRRFDSSAIDPQLSLR